MVLRSTGDSTGKQQVTQHAWNSGYNPVGVIANPWRATGDLTNRRRGQLGSGERPALHGPAKPQAVITNGSVSEIEIDGTPTGLSTGVFKLAIGETIDVTYSSSPTNTVVAD